MKKPRLLIVLPHVGHAGGGVSEAARLLAHALVNHGVFDIHVLTQESVKDTASRKDWPPLVFHAYRSYGPNSYGFTPGMVWHMLSNRYDVIHVHGVWTFHVLAAGIGILRGTPSVISPHGMLEPWILRRSRVEKALVSSLYQSYVLRKATFLHALNTKEEEDIRAVQPAARVTTIPNFVPKMSECSQLPNWLCPSLQHRKIFLFFGRIHDKKGWYPLLLAWRRLCAEDVSIRTNTALVFCGWNDSATDFESKVSEVAAETGNVVFAGPQYGDDRTASYLAADFFILPSQSEGLPMAVLEAARCGATVMMSRACNLSAFLDEKIAIDTGTDESTILASLHKALALTPQELAVQRAAAKQHVDKHYSEFAIAGAMNKTFLQALDFS